MEGKIDLQEVDKKEAAIKEKKRRLEEQKRLKHEAEERKKRDNARKAERSKWGFVGNWCPRCRKDEVEMMEDVHGKDDTKWPNGKLEKCIMPACSRINDGWVEEETLFGCLVIPCPAALLLAPRPRLLSRSLQAHAQNKQNPRIIPSDAAQTKQHLAPESKLTLLLLLALWRLQGGCQAPVQRGA
jgi:hypothetical protein